MTPEIVERSLHTMSLRIECPNSEDIFMKIELGPWETKTVVEDDEDFEETDKDEKSDQEN
ncbi:MAG: hypothetical protein ACTSPM_07925 [Candidatus Heimdallarchaeota archaeon]